MPKDIEKISILADADQPKMASKIRSVPQKVELELRFWQSNSQTQEILTATLKYTDYIELEDQKKLDQFFLNPKFIFRLVFKT